MYAVSEEYLNKIAGRSVQTNWYGSIRTTIGTVYSFDLSTIVEGSGKITRQICTGDDIEIGTTCSAELDISLYLENVDRYELYKGTITLFFQLLLDDGSWETVPIGTFIIAEPPERSMSIVSIHAYDAMLKFNQDFGTTLIGTPYSMLTYACQACGVELGTSQEEVANFANGTVETYTYEGVEIYTYRDLVGYIASYLCCYAYIGVDGKLYLKSYSMTPIREISADWRYEYKPKDYEAYYTALTSFFEVTQESELTNLGGGGLTYNLGTNPLIQFNADEVRKSVLTNIITKLSEIFYTPFSATVPCDPALMVGDVLNFTGNHAVDGKLSAITEQVITINGGMELTCAGSDPNLNVLTAVEKQIQTAAQNNNKDGMYYYDYANADAITVREGEYVPIIHFDYMTAKETHIDFHGEVKCLVDTREDYDEETDTYIEEDGVIYVTYRSGGAEITEYYPVDTFFDGIHLLNLMYAWRASSNIISSFEVLVRCTGCTLYIEQGASRGYIAGVGLVGDDVWDGTVRVYQDFKRVNMGTVIRKPLEDNVVDITEAPLASAATQKMKRRNFFSVVFKHFTESIGTSGLHRFSVPYNANEMVYENVVTSGNNWVVDSSEGADSGTVTTPDCQVERILQITSKHSGDDVAYVVSFDHGETWWLYANGWVTLGDTPDVYGMFESTMRLITPEQWAENLNGTIMLRATLLGGATLSDIQIFTEVYQ